MADAVQLALEAMVPELQDAKRKKLFTEVEIKAIVKQRTDYEYALKRRGAVLNDFLKYIQYEWQLEKIRRKRVARLGHSYKPSLCDYAGVKRLHNLFNRAVFKFPGDVDLWLQYINMAKKWKSYKRLGSIFARAIQLHPRHAGLWILAAAWEFEAQANTGSARKLMQRAVQLNGEKQELWIEWFKMECMFVTKIRARTEMLQQMVKSDTNAANGEDGSDDDEDADGDVRMSDDEDDEEVEPTILGETLPTLDGTASTAAEDLAHGIAKATKAVSSGADSSVQGDPLVQYAIPRLIFDEAATAHPTDLNLRRECLRIAVTSHGASELVHHIAQSIISTLAPSSAPALALALAYPVTPGVGGLSPSDPTYPIKLHESLSALDSALANHPTLAPALRNEILDFLDMQLKSAGPADESLKLYIKAQIQRHILAYLRASPAFASTPLAQSAADLPSSGTGPLLASTWEKLLMQLGRMPDPPAFVTRASVAAAATGEYPAHVDLARRRLADEPAWAVQGALAGFTRALDLVAVFKIVHGLVRAGKLAARPGSTQCAEYEAVYTQSAQDVMAQWRMLDRAAVAGVESDHVILAKSDFLASAMSTLSASSPAEADMFADKFISTIPIVSITWLDALVSSPNKTGNLALRRRVFQMGTTRWSKDVAWWLKFLAFEATEAKNLAGATQMYLRAVREVGGQGEGVDELVSGWNTIKG